jgi:hypothetical protein
MPEFVTITAADMVGRATIKTFRPHMACAKCHGPGAKRSHTSLVSLSRVRAS